MWALRVGSFLDHDLLFRHWIAISMKNGFARGRRLYPAHYALLMFSKGEPTKFLRPKLRPKTCRHCGKLLKDYGGYTTIITTKGVNLTDVWDDLSPVRHKTKKTRGANELPPLLFQRLFQISGSDGELFVDPFAGSGTGVVEALRAKMRFACCDLVEDNCNLIITRILGTHGG
jgi:site-specific DNA-methyltransferase (adenine-specific)